MCVQLKKKKGGNIPSPSSTSQLQLSQTQNK